MRALISNTAGWIGKWALFGGLCLALACGGRSSAPPVSPDTQPQPLPPSPPPASSHYVDLTWIASPSQVTGYYVYRATPGQEYVRLNETAEPDTDYTDQNVTAGARYIYVVTAVNDAGIESFPCDPATADIPNP